MEFAGGEPLLAAVSVQPDAPVFAVIRGESGTTVQEFTTQEPDNFTKSLSFQLSGSILCGIAFPAGERRAELKFARRTEFGKEIVRHLVIEIMGRHSGAYLLNENRFVISAARKYDQSKNTFRRIITGKPYPEPPPLSKASIIGINHADFAKLLIDYAVENDGEAAISALQAVFSGLNTGLLKLVFSSLEISADATIGRLVSNGGWLTRLFEAFKAMENGVSPGGEFAAGSIEEILEVQFRNAFSAKESKTSKPWTPRYSADRRTAQMQEELRQIERHPAVSGLAGWLVEQASADGLLGNPIPDEFRARALGVASKTGCPPQIEKLLQKNEPPEILAGLLIKTAERYKAAIPKLQSLLGDSEKTSKGKTAGISSELGKKRKQEISSLRKLGIKHKLYFSSDGVAIIVGLSDRANEALLKRYGSTPHWWFHSRDVPGSWVIALTGRAALPDRTRIECAIVAAAHSKDKDEHSVDVSYTQMKHLRKPKNSPPGRVLMREEKSVTVNPAEFAKLKDRLQSQ